MNTNNLNPIYRKDAPYIISYDWIDFIQNIGYSKFYLSRVGSTGAGVLSNNTIRCGITVENGSIVNSSDGRTNITTYTAAIDDGNFYMLGDVDFDIEIKKTITIYGKSYFGGITYAPEVGINTLEVYLVIKLRKWNGASETEIANGTTNTNEGSATVDVAQACSAYLDIATPVTFAEGETLRVTVEVWGKRDGSSGVVGFFHDPEHISVSGTTGVPTDSHINIPFKKIN